MMLFAAVLSVAAGVVGCLCPISARAILMAVAFWQFSNNPPNYVSVAYVITFLIILHSTCTSLFGGALILLVCWILVLGNISTSSASCLWF